MVCTHVHIQDQTVFKLYTVISQSCLLYRSWLWNNYNMVISTSILCQKSVKYWSIICCINMHISRSHPKDPFPIKWSRERGIIYHRLRTVNLYHIAPKHVRLELKLSPTTEGRMGVHYYSGVNVITKRACKMLSTYLRGRTIDVVRISM